MTRDGEERNASADPWGDSAAAMCERLDALIAVAAGLVDAVEGVGACLYDIANYAEEKNRRERDQ